MAGYVLRADCMSNRNYAAHFTDKGEGRRDGRRELEVKA